MSKSILDNITQVINNKDSGWDVKMDKAFNLLYPFIRKLAQMELSKLNPGDHISPTVLANECYIKLKTSAPMDFQSRQHFYNTVARCMRYFLIDLVRNHNRHKRKGQHTELNISQIVGESEISMQLLELDEALQQLESIDLELANITQLRFFSGMTLEEISELYGTNKNNIYSKWLTAKSLLINLIEDVKKS